MRISFQYKKTNSLFGRRLVFSRFANHRKSDLKSNEIYITVEMKTLAVNLCVGCPINTTLSYTPNANACSVSRVWLRVSISMLGVRSDVRLFMMPFLVGVVVVVGVVCLASISSNRLLQ